MTTTAGYCIYKKDASLGQRVARIELSDKVCDSAGQYFRAIFDLSK